MRICIIEGNKQRYFEFPPYCMVNCQQKLRVGGLYYKTQTCMGEVPTFNTFSVRVKRQFDGMLSIAARMRYWYVDNPISGWHAATRRLLARSRLGVAGGGGSSRAQFLAAACKSRGGESVMSPSQLHFSLSVCCLLFVVCCLCATVTRNRSSKARQQAKTKRCDGLLS